MAHYKLHCNGGSGNSYKLALYLNCAGLDWEPVGVDFAGGRTRDPDWRVATNAMGEVPVLEVDGRRMSQSGAILVWLAETTGKFAPIGDDARFAEKHLADRAFMSGNKPTIADFSMAGYVYYPPEETGFDIAADFPAIHAWRQRLAALPGWKPPYELIGVGSSPPVRVIQTA